LAQVYGRAIESRGPLAMRAEAEGGRVAVHFVHTAAGLRADGAAGALPAFELAGSDGRFYRAQARLDPPDRVTVESAEVPAPALVRYAWADWIEPAVTLRNAAGLPAEPFALPVRSGNGGTP
jgi:sialate O-acetylesterase